MTLTVDQSLSHWPLFSLQDNAFLHSLKLVCVFGSSGNEAIVVTHADQVYALGSNNNGCLGLGDTRASFEPRKVEELCNKGDVTNRILIYTRHFVRALWQFFSCQGLHVTMKKYSQ